MADREKVVHALRVHKIADCDDCPYYKDKHCNEHLIDDALELLKEQEPVKPTRTLSPEGNWWEDCGACDTVLLKWYTYCPNCGRKVKWDAAD